MFDLITGLSVYIICTLSFIMFRRRMRKESNIRMQIVCYLTGLFIVIPLILLISSVNPSAITLPVATVTIYLLLSAATVIVSASPLLEEASPSSFIYLYIRTYRKTTLPKIAQAIGPSLVLTKRIRAMTQSGWIKQKDGKYFLSVRGKFIANIVIIFRKLLMLPTAV